MKRGKADCADSHVNTSKFSDSLLYQVLDFGGFAQVGLDKNGLATLLPDKIIRINHSLGLYFCTCHWLKVGADNLCSLA